MPEKSAVGSILPILIRDPELGSIIKNGSSPKEEAEQNLHLVLPLMARQNIPILEISNPKENYDL